MKKSILVGLVGLLISGPASASSGGQDFECSGGNVELKAFSLEPLKFLQSSAAVIVDEGAGVDQLLTGTVSVQVMRVGNSYEYHLIDKHGADANLKINTYDVVNFPKFPPPPSRLPPEPIGAYKFKGQYNGEVVLCQYIY